MLPGPLARVSSGAAELVVEDGIAVPDDSDVDVGNGGAVNGVPVETVAAVATCRTTIRIPSATTGLRNAIVIFR